MGSASCKNSKSATPAAKNEEAKKITIGVFGLDDAGKTTAVKAIEGDPVKEAEPTIGTDKLMVPYPAIGKGKGKSKERIEMIDVGGGKRFRDRTWGECYDKVHGFIFVVDASNKSRIGENKTILNDLLDNSKLQDKPVLILANKQDKKNAIKDEDYLKDKLEIEDLKRKHRIEFCTAIGKDKSKADDAIRQGFSWLIGEIESDYQKLNARVNKTKTSTESKSPASTKKPRGRLHSEPSDMDDDGIVYGKSRQKSSSPPPSYRVLDTRSSQNLSTRLPQLDINKSKRKPSGYNTYSDNDDDKDVTNRSFSRPNVVVPMSDRTNRASSPPLSSAAAATAGFNKKKKVVGTGAVGNYDLPTNKSTLNEPKPFRSTYEPFPDDIPWTSSSIRSTKLDSTLTPKPSMINDPLKRSVSPLVRDSKPITSTLSKPGKINDDDEYGYKYGLLSSDKNKPSYPSLNRTKDDDSFKYPSPSSTTKPLTNLRKPLSSNHGLDDDDYGRKSPSIIRRSNLPPPVTTTPTTTTTAKKTNRYDDNSDNDNDYYKKTTTNTPKRLDSDDDDDRNKSKPYDRLSDRFKTNDDPYGTTSKSFSSKPKSRFADDDDDDNDKYKPAIKTRPKISDDDDDLPSSSKYDTRPKYGSDYPTSSFSKPTSRFKQDDNDRPSSPYRSTTLPKYGEDNRSTSLSRFNNNDNNRTSSTTKPSTHSKFSDDDDDRPSSKWKPSTYSKFDGDDDDRRPAPLSKIPSRSKLNEENDDDNRSFSSKKPSSSRFDDDDDRPTTLSRAPARSRFDDDDDDDRRPGTLAKVPSRSKFDDDDDDDDRPISSSRPSTSKLGTSGARNDYTSANRSRTNPYSDY
ncbi:unnamed protein product [Adineta ricciae]|uniref:Uncharacterized protein n=1 Tax=Adineta ricciae TaxID=249248 RepID=A0A814BKL9_ADIRI|nr:unnamed protein product [Adineta ricciae]CAF0963605.1 unnamed protein product [Adineta ricciae]